MSDFIYLKIQQQNSKQQAISHDCVGVEDLKKILSENQAPIVGLLCHQNTLNHYLFFYNKQNELCASPIRNPEAKKATLLPVFFQFDKDELSGTPNSFPGGKEYRPSIPENGFFSGEEEREIQMTLSKKQEENLLKQWEIKIPVNNSTLPEEYQKNLITLKFMAQESFIALLTDSLKLFEDDEKKIALQFIIANSKKRKELAETHSKLKKPAETHSKLEKLAETHSLYTLETATTGIRYECFDPKRLNDLPRSLFNNSQITIGQVYAFYRECIQQVLGNDQLNASELQEVSTKYAGLPIGTQTEFEENEICNKFGLTGEKAVIFEFLAYVMQGQGKIDASYILQYINQPKILASKYAESIIETLTDVLKTIENDSVTTITSNNTVYNYLLALYPSENGLSSWVHFKHSLNLAKQTLTEDMKFTNIAELIVSNMQPLETKKILQLCQKFKLNSVIPDALPVLAIHLKKQSLSRESILKTVKFLFKKQLGQVSQLNLSELNNTITALHQANALNEKKLETILNINNFDCLPKAISSLSKAKMLTDKSFKIVADQQKKALLSQIIVKLSDNNALNPNTFNVAASRSNEESFFRLINILNNKNLFHRKLLNHENLINEKNIIALGNYKYPFDILCECISKLLNQDSIDEEIFDALLKSDSPKQLTSGLMKLMKPEISNKENRHAVITAKKPIAMATALQSIHKMEKLDKEGKLYSTIHEIWKATKKDTFKSVPFFSCGTEPEAENTYRQIQKILKEDNSPSRDRALSVLKLLHPFVKENHDTSEFAQLLNVKFSLTSFDASMLLALPSQTMGQEMKK